MASTNITRTEKEQKIDKVYEQFDDLHIRNYVLYGNAADNKLYFEPEFTTAVPLDLLKKMMEKSMVTVQTADDEILTPVSFKGDAIVTLSGVSATPKTWTGETA